MHKTINIIAPNIKNGGALELLLYLLDSFENTYDINVIVHVDSIVKKLLSTTEKRSVIEYNSPVKKIILFFKKIDNALFFGNLPPLVKTKKSILYIHNSYLTISLQNLYNTSLNFFIKYALQQLYIKLFVNNCDICLCQTLSMSKMIEKKFQPLKLNVLPFFRTCEKKGFYKKYEFCYISLSHPHKNHLFLLEALEILANKKVKFEIVLTVEKTNKEIISKIEQVNSLKMISIINLGGIPKNKVCEVYNQSKCLVFPSSKESFGLPLIEAANLGLDIIAPNLGYVDDIVVPTLKFNINDVNDLSQKIEQYINSESLQKTKALIDCQINKLMELLVK